ncbi:MAG: DUF3662 and FHA domain-containing protein [Firmicutes bacterium]|jgi:hypothetical protein|nr:DUF3662 and FHA domain-containing protein [Bacillota bacterium]
MGLQQFEQRLERLVEGVFARAFRGVLQPVEIGRRLTREMDLQRAVIVSGVLVPNSFEVLLSKPDYERFGSFVDVLATELAEAAKQHAEDENYVFLGPVEVAVGWSEELTKSTFVVTSDFVEGDPPPPSWLLLPNGTRVIIEDEPITIGRLPECAVTLNDHNVSRRHAQVFRDGDAIMIADLDSTNGTKVNGQSITQVRLNDGDVIMIGTSRIYFETSQQDD